MCTNQDLENSCLLLLILLFLSLQCSKYQSAIAVFKIKIQVFHPFMLNSMCVLVVNLFTFMSFISVLNLLYMSLSQLYGK